MGLFSTLIFQAFSAIRSLISWYLATLGQIYPISAQLMCKSVRRIYNYKTSGKVEYDEFYLKKSKPIIDEIDKVLAQHYGFTDEELDFIITYDIKYRMGRDYDDNEP
ncbi:MAG: hypothetical protein QY317_10255 [Candidatus Jettenia caeni]|nr:MAG: hypothetical protein QY317_10255 [Candidatus Jettenia caeni]